MWFRVASHLHMTVQEAQTKMTSSEFVMWSEYLVLELNFFHREDYFLAQIAAEIRRSFVKNPSKVGIIDFLIKFVFGEKDKKEKDKMDKDLEEYTKKSKASWLGFLGIKAK
jgi:hypothetical protein